MSHSPRPRVLIVGGNFAGLSAARALSSRQFDVTVIDPTPYFEWLPHIHELISRHKKAEQLRHDRQQLLERAGHRFVQDSVTAIDKSQQRVQLASGQYLAYDELIVAVGNISLIEKIKGASEYAIPFGSVSDAERAALQLQRLDSLSLPERPVVIVGASIEGIEVLGEIIRRYRRQWRFQLHIVEAQTSIMPQYQGMDSYLKELCNDLDIQWHMGRKVQEVCKDSVVLDNGDVFASRVTLWCAGAIPHPLLAEAGLAPHGQYAAVKSTLQSSVDNHIWLAGDAAAFPVDLAKQAYHALPMGALIAKNINRVRRHRDLMPFKPLAIPSLMSFGEVGFLLFKSHAIASPSLIAAKEGLFQANFNLLKIPRQISEWHDLKDSLTFSAINMGKLVKNTWSDGKLLHARHFEAG
jgi:NADH dehydrogenase FAD-containing subunit